MFVDSKGVFVTVETKRTVEVFGVLEVHGLSGVADLVIHVAARDADDLYRVAGQISTSKVVISHTPGMLPQQQLWLSQQHVGGP